MTNDVNFEVVGKLLILLREKSGKEQQEVAKALGVSKAAVSLWESGNGIQTEKLYDLARYYNITVAELISGQLTDENEEDYFQRNYDLYNHPSFESIDDDNYDNLMDYLSRCSNVIKRLFKLYPLYMKYSLNRKESKEFDALLSYFKMDYAYIKYMSYESFSDSLRNLVEEMTYTRGFENSDDLDTELATVYELKIDVNPYEVIAYSKESSDKYLSLLKQPQKDELLTKYLIGRKTEEIENSIVIKRLLDSGARCLYRGEEFLRAHENFDTDVLEGLEGKVIENVKLEEVYKHFKKAEADAYSHSDEFFDPCSWKRLTKKGYDLIVDKETTEDVRAITSWRIEKPKLYMDYLERKRKAFKEA